MATSEWGQYKDCKWCRIELERSAGTDPLGLCIEEQLQRFRPRVSGNSGRDCFLAGEVAHAKGSSRVPPVAVAMR